MRAPRPTRLLAALALAGAGLLAATGIGNAAPAAPVSTTTFTLPAASGQGTASCTLQAYVPTGTLRNLALRGEFFCNEAVPRFRLIVSLDTQLEDGSAWGGADLALQDFTSGETSGAVTGWIKAGDLPSVNAPYTLRTAARGFIIADDWSTSTSVGRAVSGWTPPLR